MGLVSDYAAEADAIARRAWRAMRRGTGMYLSPQEVIALHEIEGDGEWWQSFNLGNVKDDPANV
jgi:hypothetical protein